MDPAGSISVSEALVAFRAANGMDQADATATTWTCKLGPMRIRLPNFAWRREAILRHDLHHVITGYPCTMLGECQMAAWEFAAGRFPHAASTAFCLPLVLAGMMWSPRAVWAAFRRGRQARSLYSTAMTDAILNSPISSLAILAEPEPKEQRRHRDVFAFLLLIAEAVSVLAASIVIAALIAEVVG
jgi:hypothetical protein